MSIATESPSVVKDRRAVYADLLSQAITGELVGMANYAAMVRLHADAEGQRQAMEHASTELRHSARFRRAAREFGVDPIVDIGAPYWRRIRESFLRRADSNDLVACLVIQEVMLESFAVAAYRTIADAAPPELAKVFSLIAEEEAAHVDHAVLELRSAHAAEPEAFEAKVETLNDEVMSTLAQMVGLEDTAGHCKLCRGACVKASMSSAGVDRATVRGRALNAYLVTLDRIGVRGERSLAWVARLPL